MHIATSSRSSSYSRRLAALAVMACAPVFAAKAQNLSQPVDGAPAAASAQAATSTQPPAASLLADNTPTLDLAHVAGISYGESSSSSLESAEAVDAERLNLAGPGTDALQPPPRRRYGRPRYNDKSHNADGSSKYAFIAGAGLTLPSGNTYHYLNTDYAFQVGAGRNFNKNASLLVQFDWDNFGFNGRTLARQSNYFFGQQGVGLDGKSHLWSFTLNPVYNIYAREGVGAYIVGGVGFYHKIAQFTVPQTGLYQDPYTGFVYQYQENAPFPGGTYASNAIGVNGGFGLTYKPSRFSSQRLYVEARYVFVDNQQRYGITAANFTTYPGPNYYPQNSNRTTYVPIKAGIRF